MSSPIRIATLSLLGLVPASLGLACPVSPHPDVKAAIQAWKTPTHGHAKNKTLAQGRSRAVASVTDELPSFGPDAWGGGNVNNWRPEAVLANAASDLLNRGWRSAPAEIDDVLVSVPTRFFYMGKPENRPYGDGQTNAAVNFGDTWSAKKPQVAAAAIFYKDGRQRIILRFAKELNLAQASATLTYMGKDGNAHTHFFDRPSSLSASRVEGDLELEWLAGADEAPIWSDLYRQRGGFVRPAGWSNVFPIDFRDSVQDADTLIRSIPDSLMNAVAARTPAGRRHLSKQELVDPEHIAVPEGSGLSASANIHDPGSFGSDIGAFNWGTVPGVHNQFIDRFQPPFPTAVGDGYTWGMIDPPSPFKTLYTCFAARSQENGVPSGGGWHEIGDPAESIFNSLESGSVLVGSGAGKPSHPPAGSSYAYGLADVAVLRRLKRGQVLVTPAGPTTLAEEVKVHDSQHPDPWARGSGAPEGRFYHWFAFHGAERTCTVEWVHPCVPTPTNDFGLDCRQ